MGAGQGGPGVGNGLYINCPLGHCWLLAQSNKKKNDDLGPSEQRLNTVYGIQQLLVTPYDYFLL